MEKDLMNKTTIRTLRRSLIAAFCIAIGVLVALVMFTLYEPSMNAMGALGTVSMDILCMIILVILLCSFAFGSYGANRTTRLFALLIVATIWALFLDFLNWAFDGRLDFSDITFWFTLLSLCMGSILACILCLYIYSYMEETHGLSQMKTGAAVCAIFNLVSFVITFILGITKTAFVFVDGHYEIGFLYDIVTAIPVLTLLYLIRYLISNRKKVGMHDILAVVGYMLFMIMGALLESEFRIGTTFVSVAIADIFIFVMLQNEIITLEKRNVEKWMQKSNIDELTGFYNRNAYEEELAVFEEVALADNFVYVSVDLNGLKAANDSYGHAAGDELIVGAAECLKKCFGEYGKLYRIGGDEFAVLLFADEDLLESLKQNLQVILSEWHGKQVDGIALSCGYMTGKEAGNLSIRQIANVADKRMYEAKALYYRTRGIERRKSGQN